MSASAQVLCWKKSYVSVTMDPAFRRAIPRWRDKRSSCNER